MKNNETEDRQLTPQEVFQEGTLGSFGVRRESAAVRRSRLFGKGIKLVSCGLTLLMGLLYAFACFTSGTGAFTVRVVDDSSFGKVCTLSLSETEGFSNPTTCLSGIPMDGMDNISFSMLNMDAITQIDGSHNGENNLAYTFYLKNSGEEEAQYNMYFEILKASKGIEKAIRVAVFRDGEYTIYAAPAENGEKEIYPEEVDNFASDSIVFEDASVTLASGDKRKYSVVIWLEGEDPECVDAIKGGSMQLQLKFEEAGAAEPEENDITLSNLE